MEQDDRTSEDAFNQKPVAQIPAQNGNENGHTREIWLHHNNQSSASLALDDVEMAHDELFSGPVAESLPTSVSAFPHHRQRADSTSSFAYYDEVEDRNFEDREALFRESESWPDIDGHLENGVLIGELDDESEESMQASHRQSTDEISLSRRSSLGSRASTRLLRRDSLISMASATIGGRRAQKIYMASEDLSLAIAGFRTGRFRSALYTLLCVCTLGLAFLLFRWLPRWRIRLVGIQCPFVECEWVVVENQWGEFEILPVQEFSYGRSLSTVFGVSKDFRLSSYDPDPELDRVRMIDYRYVRFYYHPYLDKFVLGSGWQDPSWTRVVSLKSGLDGDEKAHRLVVCGQNLIDIEQKSVFQLLIDEVLHPFYIFQVASIILWCFDDYYYYAGCIFIISVGSIITTLIDTLRTMRRLREISRFECDVRVLRNGFWRAISSADLVPGDVYELSDPNLSIFPSDSLLLTGDCIVNESMLTGESVPVSKTPATDKTLKQLNLKASTISPEVAKHFLFCGTKIIRARRPHDDAYDNQAALAMVVRTGFNTTKGALVRSMLFPKPSGFKFYRDSFRYITVMAGVAMVGFIASFVNFIRLKIEWHIIIVRALDLITIIVPPALPATLTIGTGFALNRLKKEQIFCISPQRVNVGGKVDLMCFDKTGTLTEDGLDILGVRVVRRSLHRFSGLVEKAEALAEFGNTGAPFTDDVQLQIALLHTMATCHTLRRVDDELMGDPLDLKMFEFTGWSFEEGGSSPGHDGDDGDHGSLTPSVARPPPGIEYILDRHGDIQPKEVGQGQRHAAPHADNSPQQSLELGVLRSFEFVSQLRRASVVVRPFGRQSGDIYVKGAPECMREICRPDTIPLDYDELLAHYTHKGYRVIACATRHIKKLSWVKAQKMKRHDAETQLDFVGFIIFENKLKPTTSGVIAELRRSNIPAVMCTGDNILTAISVSRECGLIEKYSHCFVPSFAYGDSSDTKARLIWESIDHSGFRLDPDSLTPLPPPAEGDASLPYDVDDLRNYSLAVTGDVFRWIVDHAPKEILKRMLVCGRVFARMSPDEKHELVEKLQSIGYCCGFCGDGANDCGALTAADIGISLSEAEASVAAPFTSRVFDIRCVPMVIREGRAALVTSFSCFKYMSLYSAIQFTSISFLYAYASNLGDFQFLYIDLLLIIPIAILMSWAGPYPILSRKRPTADLVSRKVLAPLLGQMTIAITVQTLVYTAARGQSWYVPPRVDPDETNIENSPNTVLFLVSSFEYILSGIVLNAGPPFRQGMLRNWPFVAMIGLGLTTTTYLVFWPFQGLKELMQLTDTPGSFKLYLLGLATAYFVMAWVGEHHIFPPLAKLIGRASNRLAVVGSSAKIQMQPKKRKEYKEILQRLKEGL